MGIFSRVYVEIGNLCNMNCSFCHGHSRRARRMNREEFARVLTALKGYTEYIYYHLMGEPLLHPDLPLFLRMAREEGFRSIITTNGTLLDRHGKEILAGGLHKVNISLHSFEGANHEEHIAYLSKIADFADAATESGVIVSLRLWNGGEEAEENRETIAYLRRRLMGEWQKNTRGIRIRPRLHLEWGERFDWPDLALPDGGDDVFCYGLSDHIGILADGSVVPCCLDSEGTITLGNIFEEGLDSILATPRAIAMQKGFATRHASEELCRRCGYARRFTRGVSKNSTRT